MLKKFENQEWKNYYNSFFYSCYIFNDVIFFDDVRNDKQFIIKYDERIFNILKNYKMILSTHRKTEKLKELIKIYNNVITDKIYNIDELFEL